MSGYRGTSVIPPGFSQCARCGSIHTFAYCVSCASQGYTVRAWPHLAAKPVLVPEPEKQT